MVTWEGRAGEELAEDARRVMAVLVEQEEAARAKGRAAVMGEVPA